MLPRERGEIALAGRAEHDEGSDTPLQGSVAHAEIPRDGGHARSSAGEAALENVFHAFCKGVVYLEIAAFRRERRRQQLEELHVVAGESAVKVG